MSNPINTFQSPSGWTHQGSQNAGQWQAQSGHTSAPQQAGESHTAYQTRQAAYDANKSK
jgi:hypothetical protein